MKKEIKNDQQLAQPEKKEGLLRRTLKNRPYCRHQHKKPSQALIKKQHRKST